MQSIVLDINTDAVVDFTIKLEKMRKSALPVAIRQSLNSAAFDVKQNTMPAEAKSKFINRSPNFFKANSKVEQAQGFNVNTMKATVGFVEKNLKGNSNYAVKDLEEQEHGGKISNKSFIPTNAARGGNAKRLVKPMNRLTGIKNIVDAKRAKGVNKGQRFIKSAVHAGVGGYVLAEFKGQMILWRVNSLSRTSKGAFKLTALYTYKKKRGVKVSKTEFMKTASLQSGGKIEEYFRIAAQKQIDKLI